MKPNIILIGSGGHCKSCIDVIEQENKYSIAGIVDKSKSVKSVLGYSIIGNDSDLLELKTTYDYALITIGQIQSPDIRIQLFNHLKLLGFKFPTIVSSRAYISKHAQLGEGTIVMHDALINSSAIIGNNCIINTKALIEHDVVIEDNCHISTGAIINGGTILKNGTFIGSNAVTKEYVKTKVGEFIKAGSLFKVMPMSKVFIIAEAGVNHNGSVDLAKKLIDAAADAGADAVKFQTFNAGKLATKFARKADYQKSNISANESQYEMLKKLELDEGMHKEIIEHCKQMQIMFLSSAFDNESVDMLNNFGMAIFKIPSGEITNLPYIRHVGSLKKPIILSSGMSDIGDIKNALDVLIECGISKDYLTVLHATTEYPCPIQEVNLKAMETISANFGVKVGYSDHTKGIEVSIAAVALGACVIEKHFTLDRTMEGPDHKASLEPDEFKSMVQAIRNIEKALGDGIKKPSKSEIKNIVITRKSIVALCAIKSGEIFSADNLTVKRPGDGISPMDLSKIIGQIAKRDFLPDEQIEL